MDWDSLSDSCASQGCRLRLWIISYERCREHWNDDGRGFGGVLDEKYLKRVMVHTAKVLEGVAYRSTPILAGSLVLTRAAGCKFYNHGGIVTEWPRLVHAVDPRVQEADASMHHLWAYREIGVFHFNKVREGN
jgi:hypothetical protein